MHADTTAPAASRKLMLGGSRALKGAALVVALLEAIAAQAKPEAEGLRLNARNTPLPGGDAYETGRGLLAAGDVSGAMAAFRDALLDAPQSVDTLNAIAVCYDRLGRYDVSRSYYDAALAIAPGSVQVLNNLGYSLYLQGELRGAIPMLQQAAAAGDPQAAATSRRLLQLISVKLRTNEARASMAQAVAELKSPQTRIELAANGEQRLVLAAPAPRPELVASLGDAAALTVVPKAWTKRDQKRVDAAEAVRQQAETAAILTEVAALTAADAALQAVPQPAIELASASAATLVSTAFPISPAQVNPATIIAAMTTEPRRAISFTPAVAIATTIRPARPRTPDAAASALASAADETRRQDPAGADARGTKVAKATATATAAGSAIAAAPAPTGVGTNVSAIAGSAAGAARLVASSLGFANLNLEAPAWIVASRRGAPPSSAPRIVGQSPDAEGAIGGFDSDDPVLNAFAARMRGAVNDNNVIEVAADVAISRLEALIARLRRA